MIDKYVEIYISKANENYKLYKFLKDNESFEGWQIVAIFYSALCRAKAYLYSKGYPKNTINSHLDIKNLLTIEKDAKLANVIFYYEKLYNDSRDARYSTKKITSARIERAVQNYQEVFERLPIKNC